jgi:hypothetical protein
MRGRLDVVKFDLSTPHARRHDPGPGPPLLESLGSAVPDNLESRPRPENLASRMGAGPRLFRAFAAIGRDRRHVRLETNWPTFTARKQR